MYSNTMQSLNRKITQTHTHAADIEIKRTQSGIGAFQISQSYYCIFTVIHLCVVLLLLLLL